MSTQRGSWEGVGQLAEEAWRSPWNRLQTLATGHMYSEQLPPNRYNGQNTPQNQYTGPHPLSLEASVLLAGRAAQGEGSYVYLPILYGLGFPPWLT